MAHYHVVQYNPETDGVRTLFRTTDKERANRTMDRVCENYPHAWIDIIEIKRPQSVD